MSDQFIFKSKRFELATGEFKWTAPSNIALVKYWGKKEQQIPQNPSLSFTLSNCKTTTSLYFEPKELDDSFSFKVYYEGVLKEDFHPKIDAFFKRIEIYVPFIKHLSFKIDTSNTFPHSSGIASSASGMSALALCVMSIERLLNKEMSLEYFYKKASFLSRLGSGSACRSIEGPIVSWGKHEFIDGSSDLYGLKFDESIHPIFKGFQDTILLIDRGQKQVSSTLGHNLMFNHPYASQRFSQAHENMTSLKSIFKSGNLSDFIALVESEALTLHAMMMTSSPYFILMKPNTLAVINKIWEFRNKTGFNLCFTLDAGANVHLLYPKSEAKETLVFIQNELISYCENNQYIIDEMGDGALEH